LTAGTLATRYAAIEVMTALRSVEDRLECVGARAMPEKTFTYAGHRDQSGIRAELPAVKHRCAAAYARFLLPDPSHSVLAENNGGMAMATAVGAA
jgi:hypothetical protein